MTSRNRVSEADRQESVLTAYYLAGKREMFQETISAATFPFGPVAALAESSRRTHATIEPIEELVAKVDRLYAAGQSDLVKVDQRDG